MNNIVRISMVVAALCLVSIGHASAQAFLFNNFDPQSGVYSR